MQQSQQGFHSLWSLREFVTLMREVLTCSCIPRSTTRSSHNTSCTHVLMSAPLLCRSTHAPSLKQGVDPSNVDAVEKLILDKLAELAKSGFSEGAVEAAINTIEFSLRENNTGSFPRGLSLMLRAMGAWIYDRDPYTPIQVRTRLLYSLVPFGLGLSCL